MSRTHTEKHEEMLNDAVQIVPNTDGSVKLLGKMLQSDSSRKILLLLIDRQMTANEIAEKTRLSLPLVIYHLNKMLQTGVVRVSAIHFNSKGHQMKCYSAKAGILILPETACEKAKYSKSLSGSLKRVLRLSVIGMAGIISHVALGQDAGSADTNKDYAYNDNAMDGAVLDDHSADSLIQTIPESAVPELGLPTGMIPILVAVGLCINAVVPVLLNRLNRPDALRRRDINVHDMSKQNK